jgi:hypothetical protein
MTRLLLLVGLASCAQAGSGEQQPGTDAATGDAAIADASIDAPPPCVEIMTELLNNPAFDATPMGTGWMETRIDPAYALITDEGQTGTLGK